MKKHFLLFSILLLTISGFSQAIPDSIYAVVTGNQVTIHQDDANRNCAFFPNLENLEIDANVIKWYQVDTLGLIAGCDCFFDYSVTIDSLNPGAYDVGVYYVYMSDTTFEGTTSFTIENQYSCDSVVELSSYASSCHFVDVKEIPDETITITNTTEVLSITMNSNEKIINASLLNISGQNVYVMSYLSGSEIKIPISTLKSGIYIVSVSTNSGQYNRKVVLRR